MSIGKLKLQLIALWIIAGAVSASAATLVTKSGKILRNYTIQRQDGLIVIVSHQSGISKIPIADLPDAVASRYVEPAAKRRIAMIMREKDPARRVKKLEELINRLPAAEEYAKESLARARKEKDLEDKIADALAASTADERLRRLGEALEQSNDFPHVARRIRILITEQKKKRLDDKIAEALDGKIVDERISRLGQLLEENDLSPQTAKRIRALISEQREKQRKMAGEIEHEIDAFAKDEDPDAVVKKLQALLERHPNHPYSAKQQEYLEKVNTLIAKKKSEIAKREKQRAAARNRLRETFLSQTQMPPERPRWREIFNAFQSVEQVLTRAQELYKNAQYDQAIPLVAKIIEEQPQIARVKGAAELLAKLEREKRRIATGDAEMKKVSR